ncbi:MAG: 50S ribosomal protein L24 [Clostridia bacterium]|nr:50S ribosomal protein L24 [Clostridia bacterium]
MSKLHVKKGDKVVVIAGKDAGKTGEILSVNSAKNTVVVSGVNIQAHHNKPKSKDDKGGIVKAEGGINSSNVQVVCQVCNKATRISKIEKDGKMVRACKKCGAVLDNAKTTKATKTTKKSTKKSAEDSKAE